MARRPADYDDFDESALHHRPSSRGSRPRTKRRPSHRQAVTGMIVEIDRGRYRVALAPDRGALALTGSTRSQPVANIVTCVRAQELRRTRLAVGDRVSIVGDISGAPDTLARIVALNERTSVLLRSGDDSDTLERVVVANADQLYIVAAAANPEPRIRLIDRSVIAAINGGVAPHLVITKEDLASAEDLVAHALELDIPVHQVGPTSPIEELASALEGHITALVGASGVGKSTLLNRLVPTANRRTGAVNMVTGRGRHTSSSAHAMQVCHGWVIDTPGVRSFGLGHVTVDLFAARYPAPHSIEFAQSDDRDPAAYPAAEQPGLTRLKYLLDVLETALDVH